MTTNQQLAQQAAKKIREVAESFDHWRLCPGQNELASIIATTYEPVLKAMKNVNLMKRACGNCRFWKQAFSQTFIGTCVNKRSNRYGQTPLYDSKCGVFKAIEKTTI